MFDKRTYCDPDRFLDDCWSSHLCALEDADDVTLFHASWGAPQEPIDAEGFASVDAPTGVTDECPDVDPPDLWSTAPPCVPSGRRHPLNQADSFRTFARAQYGEGPFRFCVNSIKECYEEDINADLSQACFVGE